MKLEGFEIVEFCLGEKAAFYTIKLSGESETEIDKFLTKYSKEKEEQIDAISLKIKQMAETRGCLDTLITKEYDNIYKFKEEKIRLFCLRFGKVAIILGGGGIKEPNIRATQDSVELTGYVKLLEFVDQEINKRIYNKEIFVTDNRITGDLKFNF